MHNIDTIYLFIFVFTILVTSLNVLKFLRALLQREPKPMVLSNRELLLLGVSISYLITYLAQT
jgi:hypothetical protein